jgi:hypothetical protein
MQSFCDTKAAIEICPSAPQVTTGLCVASGCDTITCVTKTITFTQTLAGCNAAVVYTDKLGVVLTSVKEVPCPQKVEVTNLTPAPPPQITIAGVDCAGAPVAATGLTQQIVQTVPHPTAVQLVKLCTPQKDYEVERACNYAGEPVLVQYDAGVVPPLELSRTNMLTGLAEPAGTLRRCDDDDIELVPLKACFEGQEITGVAIIADRLQPFVISELWRLPGYGGWGSLPSGAVIGECGCQDLTAAQRGIQSNW